MSVEQDPSLPARRRAAAAVPTRAYPSGRRGRSRLGRGVPQSIFGEVLAQSAVDTRPALTATRRRSLRSQRRRQERRCCADRAVVLRLPAGSLAWPTRRSSRPARVPRLFIDANPAPSCCGSSELQTQSAVGTGRGLVGDTKKMSVRLRRRVRRRRSSAPAGADDVRHARNLTRAINVLYGAPLFASDLATDTDNNWTDISGGRRPRLHRLDLRLLLQASRAARPGQS